MKTTSLLINDLDLSVEPDFEDSHFGWVDIEFRVIGDPEYLDELGALTAEFGLDIDLNTLPNPLVNDIDEQEKVGEIEVEVVSVIEGEKDEFEEYIAQWKEENYRSLPFNFRYHIESAFMTEVMSPLANLLNNTFRGIVPQVTFTENPPDVEEENYEINIDDNLSDEKMEKMQSKIEEVRNEISSDADDLTEEIEELTGESLSLELKTEFAFSREDDDEEEQQE